MVVIGSTGAGKSTLLNGILKGKDCNNDCPFLVSSDTRFCTSETKCLTRKVYDGFNLGPDFTEITLIDTPGMNSGEKNDALHLTDMIEKLKEK